MAGEWEDVDEPTQPPPHTDEAIARQVQIILNSLVGREAGPVHVSLRDLRRALQLHFNVGLKSKEDRQLIEEAAFQWIADRNTSRTSHSLNNGMILGVQEPFWHQIRQPLLEARTVALRLQHNPIFLSRTHRRLRPQCDSSEACDQRDLTIEVVCIIDPKQLLAGARAAPAPGAEANIGRNDAYVLANGIEVEVAVEDNPHMGGDGPMAGMGLGFGMGTSGRGRDSKRNRKRSGRVWALPVNVEEARAHGDDHSQRQSQAMNGVVDLDVESDEQHAEYAAAGMGMGMGIDKLGLGLSRHSRVELNVALPHTGRPVGAVFRVRSAAGSNGYSGVGRGRGRGSGSGNRQVGPRRIGEAGPVVYSTRMPLSKFDEDGVVSVLPDSWMELTLRPADLSISRMQQMDHDIRCAGEREALPVLRVQWRWGRAKRSKHVPGAGAQKPLLKIHVQVAQGIWRTVMQRGMGCPICCMELPSPFLADLQAHIVCMHGEKFGAEICRDGDHGDGGRLRGRGSDLGLGLGLGCDLELAIGLKDPHHRSIATLSSELRSVHLLRPLENNDAEAGRADAAILVASVGWMFHTRGGRPVELVPKHKPKPKRKPRKGGEVDHMPAAPGTRLRQQPVADRNYLHSFSLQPCPPEESDSESDMDEGWLMDFWEDRIRDFVDVSEAEKRFFILWNAYARTKSNDFLCHKLIPDLVLEFIEQKGDVLRSDADLRRQFTLHLLVMRSHGYINSEDIFNICLRLDKGGGKVSDGSGGKGKGRVEGHFQF